MDQLTEALSQWQVITAVVIFLLTYTFIITEKINRAIATIAGAVLMILFGIMDIHMAYTQHIRWETLILIMGMMIIVGIMNRTGVFQYAAIKAVLYSRGKPVRLLVYLLVTTAVGSSFINNVTIVLLMVPITISVTRMLKISPIPYLIGVIIATNIGGSATLIGDSTNMILGTATPHLTFNDFIVSLAPVIIVIMIVTIIILVFYYRKQLVVDPSQMEQFIQLDTSDYIQDKPLMLKSSLILLLTIIGFTIESYIHVEPAVIAVAGATLLLLIGVKEAEIEYVFQSMDWVAILFFVGLFTLVGGLVDAGIIHNLASRLLEITEDNYTFMSMFILWFSGIASVAIDNIPYITTMIPVIQDMGFQLASEPEQINSVWWALALGTCLGGNGTLIGATANVVVAGMAYREGFPISYIDYLKIGAPITLISLVISTIYMLIFLL